MPRSPARAKPPSPESLEPIDANLPRTFRQFPLNTLGSNSYLEWDTRYVHRHVDSDESRELSTSSISRSVLSRSGVGLSLARATTTAYGFRSPPMACLPFAQASSGIVPDPQNGSYTVSPVLVSPMISPRARDDSSRPRYGQRPPKAVLTRMRLSIFSFPEPIQKPCSDELRRKRRQPRPPSCFCVAHFIFLAIAQVTR